MNVCMPLTLGPHWLHEDPIGLVALLASAVQ